MICDHPDCTGVHNHNAGAAKRCPASRAQQRAYDTERRSIPEIGERHRVASREWRPNLPPIRYALEGLKNRRRKALTRMAKRNQLTERG